LFKETASVGLTIMLVPAHTMLHEIYEILRTLSGVGDLLMHTLYNHGYLTANA